MTWTFNDDKLIEYIGIGMCYDYSRTAYGELLSQLDLNKDYYSIKTDPYTSYNDSLLFKCLKQFTDIDLIHYLLTQKHIYIGYKSVDNNIRQFRLPELYTPLQDIFYMHHFIYKSEDKFIKWFESIFYLLDNNAYCNNEIMIKLKNELHNKVLNEINSYSSEKLNNYYNELTKRFNEYHYTNI